MKNASVMSLASGSCPMSGRNRCRCSKIIESLHKSQLLAFLKLSGLNRGLLVNFNVPDLQDGIVQIENHQKK
jgi:hypothetical protein